MFIYGSFAELLPLIPYSTVPMRVQRLLGSIQVDKIKELPDNALMVRGTIPVLFPLSD
jgi:hypothetical protein